MKQRSINIMLGFVVAIAQLTGAGAVHAAPIPDHVVILAVQTGQTGAAGSDFVEVYNPSAATIDVTGWKLQYRAATATGTATWTTKRTVACTLVVSGCTVTLPAHAHLVFATYDVVNVDEQLVG